VICSATSEPQLKAIANEIETRLREDHSIRPVAIDGFPASQWIVLDYLQVVVHVFHRDKRSFYSLEDLWGDAPRLEWEAAQRAEAPISPRGSGAGHKYRYNLFLWRRRGPWAGGFRRSHRRRRGSSLASSSSTSKIRVELEARSGLTDLSP